MTNSFFPAARRVVQNPIVKWLGGALLALLTAALTTGVWPFFRGWVATRADTGTVEGIDGRVTKIEKAHSVDFGRLDSAKGDDTGALNEGEQLQWALIRIKRLQMRVVQETRSRIGLEAMIRMPNPRSEPAQRMAAAVRAKFDDLMFKGEDPNVAAQKALEDVYGPAPR
jgi:hypothetical protein